MSLNDTDRDEILLRILRQILSIKEGLAESHLYSNFHFKYEFDKEEKFLNDMKDKHKEC